MNINLTVKDVDHIAENLITKAVDSDLFSAYELAAYVSGLTHLALEIKKQGTLGQCIFISEE